MTAMMTLTMWVVYIETHGQQRTITHSEGIPNSDTTPQRDEWRATRLADALTLTLTLILWGIETHRRQRTITLSEGIPSSHAVLVEC